jgi:hypothetical protein
MSGATGATRASRSDRQRHALDHHARLRRRRRARQGAKLTLPRTPRLVIDPSEVVVITEKLWASQDRQAVESQCLDARCGASISPSSLGLTSCRRKSGRPRLDPVASLPVFTFAPSAARIRLLCAASVSSDRRAQCNCRSDDKAVCSTGSGEHSCSWTGDVMPPDARLIWPLEGRGPATGTSRRERPSRVDRWNRVY